MKIDNTYISTSIDWGNEHFLSYMMDINADINADGSIIIGNSERDCIVFYEECDKIHARIETENKTAILATVILLAEIEAGALDFVLETMGGIYFALDAVRKIFEDPKILAMSVSATSIRNGRSASIFITSGYAGILNVIQEVTMT